MKIHFLLIIKGFLKLSNFLTFIFFNIFILLSVQCPCSFYFVVVIWKERYRENKEEGLNMGVYLEESHLSL